MKLRRARVVYSYAPQNQDELELKVDDIIEVLEEVEEGWWKGRLKGATGVFPSNFVAELDDSALQQELSNSLLARSGSSSDLDSDVVDGSKQSKGNQLRHSSGGGDSDDVEIKPNKVIGIPTPITFGIGNQLKNVVLRSRGGLDDKNKNSGGVKKQTPVTTTDMSEPAPKLPPKPVREQAKVLYAYEAQNEDELTIKEGEIIGIISKEIEDQGWWRGELNGKIGVFPDNFVELIKVPAAGQPEVQEALPPRGKKPESNKQPVGSPPRQTASFNSGPPKDGKTPPTTNPSTRSDDQPTSKVGAFLLGKKPAKVSGSGPGFNKSPSSVTQASSNNKPDVVPQDVPVRNVDKDDSAENSTSDRNSTNLGSLDTFASSMSDSASNNKLLSHLTASRPKPPNNRRPPSYISVPKDNDDQGLENGDSLAKHTTPVTDKRDSVNLSDGNLVAKMAGQQPKGTPATAVVSSNQVDEAPIPPWMKELRETQKRKNNASTIPSPSEAEAGGAAKETINNSSKPAASVPTSRISPSRTSGEFNKFVVKEPPSELQSSSLSESSTSNPISILKPSKPVKPGPGSSQLQPSPPTTTTSSSAGSCNSINSNAASATAAVSSGNKPLLNTLTSSASAAGKLAPNLQGGPNAAAAAASVVKQEQLATSAHGQLPGKLATSNSESSSSDVLASGTSSSEFAELRHELKLLRESTVSKSEHEDLLKQVSELKETVETQKQSYRSAIKDLINDVADEKKKLATLQIEVDRLRKLTTTV